jgi:hypothetical protein
VKLLLDEQISGKVAERLRRKGHEVLATTEEPALRGLSDPDLFELAQSERRTVVTYNRVDFEALVREYAEAGRDHHGLVLIHPIRFPGSDFGRIAKALEGILDEPERGKSFTLWLQDG